MNIGTRVGPYEVRENAGEGGMAKVYKVWHTGLHRFEALKTPTNASCDPNFVQRFLAEARTAAQLQHPHIAAIYGVSDAEAPQPYFCMEWVEGWDLSALVKHRGIISLDEALPILEQVADALDYAHAHGVIHRDIKPSNVLLQITEQSGWQAKVVDFGIARAQEDSGGTRLTKTGMIVGTPEYMSPEQAGSGEPVDQRSDLYSLGVVAYEMLCGRPPFLSGENATPMTVIINHVKDPPPDPLHWNEILPLHVREALLKALAKSPSDRHTSCSAFVKALRNPVPDSRSSSQTIIAPKVKTETMAGGREAAGMQFMKYALVLVIAIGAIIIGVSVIHRTPTPSSPPPTEPPFLTDEPPPPPPVKPVQPHPGSDLAPGPGVSTRAVTHAKLEGKSAWELDVMRNSIYARHGRRFRRKDLQAYFDKQPWYHPRADFNDSTLSEQERKNAAFILRYQKENGKQ